MKKLSLLTIAAMWSAFAFSQDGMTLQEIVSFMSTNDYRCCFVMTNSLDAAIVSTTGTLERSSLKLLKASILLDHAENTADLFSFAASTNLCAEIESDLLDTNAWQRIGALCKYSDAMLKDGHPEVAFAASTNLLSFFRFNQSVAVDTNVWNVLFKPGGLDVMSPFDFIRANAAASCFRMDPSGDVSPYTNGLPQEVLHEILRP